MACFAVLDDILRVKINSCIQKEESSNYNWNNLRFPKRTCLLGTSRLFSAISGGSYFQPLPVFLHVTFYLFIYFASFKILTLPSTGWLTICVARSVLGSVQVPLLSAMSHYGRSSVAKRLADYVRVSSYSDYNLSTELKTKEIKHYFDHFKLTLFNDT